MSASGPSGPLVLLDLASFTERILEFKNQTSHELIFTLFGGS